MEYTSDFFNDEFSDPVLDQKNRIREAFGVSPKETFDCIKTRREDIKKLEMIFPPKSAEDVRACTALIYMNSLGGETELLQAFGEDYGFCDNFESYFESYLEENRVFLVTALMCNDRIFSMTDNICGLLRLKLASAREESTGTRRRFRLTERNPGQAAARKPANHGGLVFVLGGAGAIAAAVIIAVGITVAGNLTANKSGGQPGAAEVAAAEAEPAQSRKAAPAAAPDTKAAAASAETAPAAAAEPAQPRKAAPAAASKAAAPAEIAAAAEPEPPDTPEVSAPAEIAAAAEPEPPDTPEVSAPAEIAAAAEPEPPDTPEVPAPTEIAAAAEPNAPIAGASGMKNNMRPDIPLVETTAAPEFKPMEDAIALLPREALTKNFRTTANRNRKQSGEAYPSSKPWEPVFTSPGVNENGSWKGGLMTVLSANGTKRTAGVDNALRYYSGLSGSRPYEAYTGRGIAYLLKGSYREAADDFTAAINRNNKRHEAYYNRGMVYAAQRQTKNAITDLEKALALSPGSAEIYYALGNLYRNSGEPDAKKIAAGYLKSLQTIVPGYRDSLQLLEALEK